jgi:S-adenosylmethionine synthetase
MILMEDCPQYSFENKIGLQKLLTGKRRNSMRRAHFTNSDDCVILTNLEITFGNSAPVSRLPVEFVERKGKGHPDTLSDRAAEELSIALSQYYLDNFGRIFHHNVDKCVLVGGQAEAWFGGGRIIDPIQIILVGRAAAELNGVRVPIDAIAEETTKKWLRASMHHLDVEKDLTVCAKIRPGSVDLVKNFESSNGVPLANDTSFGVCYAPLTQTERLVLEIEKRLNSEDVKRSHPQIGEDVKVMGVRRDHSINVTVASAIVSPFVKDEAAYRDSIQVIHDLAQKVADKQASDPVEIQVNSADNYVQKNFYLTVTGTSAEHGDDGQVGRGNRANGLITPFRPMTLEAAGGKNPVNHTGKIYNVVARKIVSSILKEHPSLEQVSCYLVSRIGKPITEPQAVNVEIYADKTNAIEGDCKGIVEEKLAEMPSLWKEIVRREHSLF